MTAPTSGQSDSSHAEVAQRVERDRDRLVETYKDIHRNPELGFRERRTSSIVADELRRLHFDVVTDIAGTGVVGILRNGDGPTVMYRADMDANAVQETTGLEYASTVRAVGPDGVQTPVAHMCGHDAHVTWMLGAARIMDALKDRWHGTLIMLGQPAEELIAGARAMVDDGLYQRHGVPIPDQLVALHTGPLATGVVVHAPGVRMAGTEQFDVRFFGVGGHGSMPHLTKDPVVMAALAVVEYQMILSRAIDPQEAAVLTVGSIQAGNDNNVIPSEALVKVNTRFFSAKIRDELRNGVMAISNGIARTYGVPEDRLPTLTLKGGSMPLANDADLVARLEPVLRGLLGESAVLSDFPPVTGSEDCAELIPDGSGIALAYIFVGTAPPAMAAAARAEGKLFPFSTHNGNYVVDLDAIPLGTKIGTAMLLDLLGRGR